MAPNATNPMSTASICAVMNAICCDISCNPPYVNQFNIVLLLFMCFPV